MIGQQLVWLMMFNTTFNNISVISWQTVLLLEETMNGVRTLKVSGDIA
jgi:hypothetical protein